MALRRKPGAISLIAKRRKLAEESFDWGLSSLEARGTLSGEPLTSAIRHRDIHRLALALDPHGPPFPHELLEGGLGLLETGFLQALERLSRDLAQ